MTAKQHTPSLEAGRRVIVKIGSALLVDAERGTLHRRWLEALAADLARCRERRQDVIIVSSGAIALGRRHLRFSGGDLKLEEKQAAAATGMVRLAHAYEEVLGRQGMTVAQVLLTLDDSDNRRRYLNARNTLSTLLRLGAVPLINENDTVATDEIRFGENDRLAGRVAAMISADVLVLLSDIDGFYSADPRREPGARHIPIIDQITPEIEAMAGSARTDYGSGGMITKIAAAKSAVAAGCATVVADGKPLHPLRAIEDGARCTWFLPRANPRAARKHWIAGILGPAGAITIDNGAMKALGNGKSLLPAGVTEVEGAFKRGDAVIVKAGDGRKIGRGLSAYSADDARRIMGHKSGEIESLLGYRGRDEMIHRDDLVLS
ncbi:MAG: glutamate 5-kinase [Rhodospirillales bacterium]|jgi:glutamate 5-kinase|nr:glutamate 5-kinase [Rhodospirillales bacterium]HIJ43697.1 glutamate 5-kinase [Rhodospirillaceae bacterium]MDP7097981.1 glutamate 5-kinase [Rhodospirillales bacterium]HIJ44977.1 glutamate 5-kinase [Rhodospirillaceae bacterium]HIJ92884.1 glutamate 5-kinase [Rhodospirillaceae bacterium]